MMEVGANSIAADVQKRLEADPDRLILENGAINLSKIVLVTLEVLRDLDFLELGKRSNE